MASTQHSNVPPPLPPPPRDLPEGYRALTGWNLADNHKLSHSRTTSRDSNTSNHSRTSAITNFLSRSKSQNRDVPSPDNMLRKQKLQEQEERLRQHHNLQLDTEPVSNKSSNFSRPHAPTTMPLLTKESPVLPKHSPVSPRFEYSPSLGSSPSIRSPGEYLDPYSRADALSGRYSSTSGSTMSNFNSPRRVRRKKDPTPFNILVMGAKGSGKTSLVTFLKDALTLAPEKQTHAVSTPRIPVSDGPFTAHYVETEVDNERIGVTIWDSEGLEKSVADLQVRKAVGFIHSKFEETFAEESKVMRSTNAKDSHIHCILLVVDPSNLENDLRSIKTHSHGNAFARAPAGPIQNIDLMVMTQMRGRVTVLPVISKADTLTAAHRAYLKSSVWNSILAEKVNPLDFLGQDDSEDEDEFGPGQTAGVDNGSRQDEVYLPFTVLTPDPYGDGKVRTFPWGQADPLNPAHCDFGRLRDTVFGEWRDDLRTTARETGYEQWRTAHLARKEGRPVEISLLGGATPRSAAAF